MLHLACSAGVFVLELAVVSSPPYWLEQSRWGGGVTSPFSLTPTPWDAFLSLSKPLPSLNPRWRSLDQTRSLARQNTPALQFATHAESAVARVTIRVAGSGIESLNGGSTFHMSVKISLICRLKFSTFVGCR